MSRSRGTSAVLAPYVPRLAQQWDEITPNQRWREFDGSLVFVDISGFTALSERLARRGRQGAEELTGTISTCFADLLGVAYAAGGSLLKFGGDALLLLFDGPGHAMRAATSAVRMRTTMAEVGKVTTSVGNIRLRMSVGVHSGQLHLFRVGESHRELIVTGPGVSTTVDMESTAQAGEIVVSPGTVEQIDASLVGPPKGPGFLLRRRRLAADGGSYPPVPQTASDLTIAIPTALREHLGGTVEPEHRQATIAFVHFDDIDALIDSSGAAAAAEALDELTADVQAAAELEGVTFLATDADHDGGKFILVGGAPRLLGDDEGRMLRALRRVADGKRRLPTRFGVNRGHVFVGEVGPPYRRTYTVMGDTVNLAARLMAKATAGQIIATSGVLESSATEFAVEPLPPFMVKGKAKPIEAFAVGAQGDARARGDLRGGHALPFLGRDEELATLSTAWEGARAGRGGLVEVSGDAGIGKSRLISELLDQLGGASVITTFCEMYEADTPYFAMRHLLRGALAIRPNQSDGAATLRRVVSETAPQLQPWIPLLAEVIGEEVPSTEETRTLAQRFRRERTGQVVVELLEAVAGAPHVFVVEDAQWADPASAEVFAALSSAATQNPWLICLLRRPEAGTYVPDDEVTLARLQLGPLTDEASRAVVAAASREALLRPDERDAIVRQAGGNPLFLAGLLESIGSADAGAALPDSLEALVATQIDRLASEDRKLLRYAAVLGPIFEVDRLTELAAGEVNRSPAAAVRRLRSFLEPAGAGWARFQNQCYRQVAYETLSFGRRRELHERAALALEASTGDASTEHAETLSYHFLHAHDYERCWSYARVAAEHAAAKYANVEAVNLYDRALTAALRLKTPAEEEVATAWEALGDVALLAGISDRAKVAFGRARKLRGHDTAGLARLCHKEANAAMYAGQSANMVRWANRGLRLVDEVHDTRELSARAELRLLRGEQEQQLGRSRRALRWCDLAIEDAMASEDWPALARAYTVRDVVSLQLGKPEEMTHLPLALSIWEELGSVRDQAVVLSILGSKAYYAGCWDEALGMYERGAAAFLRAGDANQAGYATCNISELLISQGRGDEAVDGLHAVLDQWRAARHEGPVADALINLGRCALQRGDVAEARELFSEAKSRAGAVTEPASIGADAWLAECHIHVGEAELALPILDEALRRETSTGDTTFVAKLRRMRGYACAALDRTDEAFAEFELSLEAARLRGSTYEEALTLEAVAAARGLAGLPMDRPAEARRRALLAELGVRATFAPKLTPVLTDDSV